MRLTVTGNKEFNALDIRVRYDIGGTNYFTSRLVKRGYYLMVTPSLIRECGGYSTVTQTAFTGTSYLLNEVSRKSKKAESKAFELANIHLAECVRYVCEANGIDVPDIANIKLEIDS